MADQVPGLHPRQDEEAGIVEQERQVGDTDPRAPADEGVACLLMPARRVEGQPADAPEALAAEPPVRTGWEGASRG